MDYPTEEPPYQISTNFSISSIGLLLGGIIQGQKIWYNARISRITSDLQDYTRVFLLYYDRYGMYPGDEDDPNFPPGDSFNGNHNSLIDSNEAVNVWEDLYNSLGIVRKSSPVRGGSYEFGYRNFNGVNRNYIAVTNIPNNQAQAIDRRYDDGAANTGNIQASADYDGSETLITLYWRI